MSKRIRLSISPAEEWETDWLKWFLCQEDTSASGTADSLLSASSVAKTRQAHLITACALYDLMKSAFINSEGQFDDEERELQSFRDWCNIRQKQSPQFHFWGSILI